MLNFIRPRLRVPLITAIAGTILAVAWVIRGGNDWWLAFAIEAAAIARFVMLYIWAGEDSDDGAMVGSRGDERQQLVALRCWAVTGKVAMIASLLGLAVTVATRSAAVWAFVGLVPITLIAFGLSMSRYSGGVSDPADDASAGYTAHPAAR